MFIRQITGHNFIVYFNFLVNMAWVNYEEIASKLGVDSEDLFNEITLNTSTWEISDAKKPESSTGEGQEEEKEDKEEEQTAEGSESEDKNKNKESDGREDKEEEKEKDKKEEKKEDKKEEKKIPLHRDERFKEVYAEKKKYREEAARYKKELEDLKRGQGNLNRKFAEYFSTMSPEEALEKMKEDLYNDAKLKLEQEKTEEQLKNEEADEFIYEAFGHLEEKYGVELNDKDQEEISKIIIKYKITVEDPEDFEKAYEIYDLQKKAGWTGKSKKIESVDSKVDKNPMREYRDWETDRQSVV